MSKPSHFPAMAGTALGLLAAALGAWLLYPQHLLPDGQVSAPVPAQNAVHSLARAAATNAVQPAGQVAVPVALPGQATSPQLQATAPQVQPITREQAEARLMALPELQAWARRIEQASGGKVHGAVVAFDAALLESGGRRYHQLDFVENRPDAAVTWESFLVDAGNGEVLVVDAASRAILPLARWRAERHPLARATAGPGRP